MKGRGAGRGGGVAAINNAICQCFSAYIFSLHELPYPLVKVEQKQNLVSMLWRAGERRGGRGVQLMMAVLKNVLA